LRNETQLSSIKHGSYLIRSPKEPINAIYLLIRNDVGCQHFVDQLSKLAITKTKIESWTTKTIRMPLESLIASTAS
jgi:hypothetical protein